MHINLDNKTVDLGTLDRQQLTELKLQIQERKDLAHHQIDRAKRKAARTGIYADSDRFTELEHKVRTLGRQLQTIGAQFSLLNRERQQQRTLDWNQRFIDQARSILSQDTWDFIVSAIERE